MTNRWFHLYNNHLTGRVHCPHSRWKTRRWSLPDPERREKRLGMFQLWKIWSNPSQDRRQTHETVCCLNWKSTCLDPFPGPQHWRLMKWLIPYESLHQPPMLGATHTSVLKIQRCKRVWGSGGDGEMLLHRRTDFQGCSEVCCLYFIVLSGSLCIPVTLQRSTVKEKVTGRRWRQLLGLLVAWHSDTTLDTWSFSEADCEGLQHASKFWVLDSSSLPKSQGHWP